MSAEHQKSRELFEDVRKLWSPDKPDSQANCLHRLVGLFRQFRDDMPLDMTADRIIAYCERFGLGWSLDHAGQLIEARIWNWPNVVGRYRPHKVEPLALMLWMALRNAHDSLPNAKLTRAQTDAKRSCDDSGRRVE